MNCYCRNFFILILIFFLVISHISFFFQYKFCFLSYIYLFIYLSLIRTLFPLSGCCQVPSITSSGSRSHTHLAIVFQLGRVLTSLCVPKVKITRYGKKDKSLHCREAREENPLNHSTDPFYHKFSIKKPNTKP